MFSPNRKLKTLRYAHMTWMQWNVSPKKEKLTILISSARAFFWHQQKNAPTHMSSAFGTKKHHAHFFAIRLCYARLPKHMNSWYTISSPWKKTDEKHWFALWHLSFTWYSQVTSMSSHIRLRNNNTKTNAHTRKTTITLGNRSWNLMTSNDRMKK